MGPCFRRGDGEISRSVQRSACGLQRKSCAR